MLRKDKRYYLEEELLLVQNSGEIPEVAYHGSLYYLTEDPEGPALPLSAADLLPLQQAVYERYRRIILRDLNPALRSKRIYRGLLRCIANWKRFCNYCNKAQLNASPVRQEAAAALVRFLQQEKEDVQQKGRPSSINCSAAGLGSLIEAFALSPEKLPEGWESLCPA
jgi:hypothetical protein